MHAFLVLAISNSSRTILAPYKTQSLTLSEDNKNTEKKQEKMSKKWNPKKIQRLSQTSPTYFCTSSDPITLIKQASVLLATALAHNVFPVPGGPNKRTPLGGSIPRLTNRSGWRKIQNPSVAIKNINGKWRVNCFTWVQQPVQFLVPLNSSERSQPCCFVYTNILLMSWNIIYLYFHVIMLFTVVTSYQDIAPEGFAC